MRRVNALSAMMLLGTVVGSAGAQSYSKTNVITYHDDLSKWVLGQVRTSVNQDTGRTESQVDYDPATAKPQRIHAFGQLQQTIHYNSDGTVRAVVDGRGNTVSLSGWKRGIPGNIQYADGSTQSAGVDDNGWIRWITDGRGNTTRYDYDAMGRMSLVDYPDGDTVDWASTTTQFAQVGGAEYGIPAGHWRQTVSTGNARKVTYYDALWRPLLVREYDAGNEAGTQRASVTAYDTEGGSPSSPILSRGRYGPGRRNWRPYDVRRTWAGGPGQPGFRDWRAGQHNRVPAGAARAHDQCQGYPDRRDLHRCRCREA